MAKGTPKHIHKYMKATLSYATVWRCAMPGCTHHMPKHMEALVVGRASICWGCGNQFVLDEQLMKEDMPTCFGCKSSEVVDIDDFLSTIVAKHD